MTVGGNMGMEAALAPWVIHGWGEQRGDRELLCVLTRKAGCELRYWFSNNIIMTA